MMRTDRFLTLALASGAWALAVLQVNSNSEAYAQEIPATEHIVEENGTQTERSVINATDIVGLNALIEKVLRESQIRPQSISGLDQYIKSVVRGCRVSGGVTGDRISYASISC